MLKITIPGKPIAKKRPKFARRGKYTITYSDQETDAGKTFLHVKEQINGHFPFTGPIFVRSEFFFPRPKNHYGTGKNADKLKTSAPRYHTKKPDVDNIVKFYFDILNGLVWKDDSQVISEYSDKKYCAPGDQPRVDIQIMEVL